MMKMQDNGQQTTDNGQRAKRVLFVRSGGGLPGIDIHAGIWAALEMFGIVSTENSGTSAGALVSAYDSSGWAAQDFIEYLRSHQDSDVRHERIAWKLRLPWIESIHDNDRIRASLDGSLHPDFGALGKPLSAWAVERESGDRVNVARPEVALTLQDALLASMAVPVLFPPVKLNDGKTYVDGGLRFNLPLPANWTDYDEVWLLIASSAPEGYVTGRFPILTEALNAFQILMADQIRDPLEDTEHDPHVHVVWPHVAVNDGLLHFNHDLIGSAFALTHQQLTRMKQEGELA